MTEPVIDYGQRAGARERPSIWVEPDPAVMLAHTRDEGMLYAAVGQTFWADISTYQVVVDDSYPYPVLGFRADSGSSIDSHAAANWAYCEAHPDHIQVAIPYVVFKPGQSSAILQRMKNQFGAQCPPNIVPEIDMESGAQFAGPGDHSSEANDLAAAFAAWSGNRSREQGYANSPDWSGNWPSPQPWMKKRLAKFSSSPLPTGYYSVQYYGALPYPSPAGYPRSCQPFGAYVDMNMTPRTINQIVADYAIGDPVAVLDSDDYTNIAAAVWHQKMQGQLTAQYQADVLLTDIRAIVAAARDSSASASNHAISVDSKADQIQQAVGALPTPDQIADAVIAKLPTGGGAPGAPTLAQITDAFTAVINDTKLIH